MGVVLDGPQRPPHRGVAFEAGPEPDLPHDFASLHALARLDVAQRVPERGGGRVAVPEERVVRGGSLVGGQVQLLGQAVDDAPPARVQAKVVKRFLEVGRVRRRGPAAGQQGPCHRHGRVLDLLRHGQDERRHLGQVALQGLARHLDEVAVELDPHHAVRVLALEDALVRHVVGAQVDAHAVGQLVLGARPLGRLVRQDDGGPAHAEERVGDQHRPVVAQVPVLGDVFGRHHQRVRALPVHAQQLLGQADRDDAGGAAHARQVVRHRVGPELEVVHDHGRQGGGRVEEGAVDDQDVDVLGLQPRPRQGLAHDLEQDHAGLLARLHHRPRLRAGAPHAGGPLVRVHVQGRREVAVVRHAVALGDAGLEVHGLFREASRLAGLVDEGVQGGDQLLRALVAGKVQKVAPALGSGCGRQAVRGRHQGRQDGAGRQGDGHIPPGGGGLQKGEEGGREVGGAGRVLRENGRRREEGQGSGGPRPLKKKHAGPVWSARTVHSLSLSTSLTHQLHGRLDSRARQSQHPQLGRVVLAGGGAGRGGSCKDWREK